MLTQAKRVLVSFWKDESGDILQTAIIMAVLAVIAIGAFTFLGPRIKATFDTTGRELDSAKGWSY